MNQLQRQHLIYLKLTSGKIHVGIWGKSWKRFGNLQNMSTYLVAMVAGEFDMISNLIKEEIVVSVYTAPEQSARGRLAIDVATKALSFFTETFGIPLSLNNW
ncbi:putative peptidase M1, alanine aminopeptidase/leukotriene A4 hydrolase [Plasmopara halstedii]